jgi:hypothetical protein
MYWLYYMYDLYGIVTPFSGIVNRNHLLRNPRKAKKFLKRKLYQNDSLNLLSNVTVLPMDTPAPLVDTLTGNILIRFQIR